MKPPQRSSLVTLTQWEWEWAMHVGQQRHEIREPSGNAKHYDPARMEDNLRASRAAASVEMAVAKYKKAYWSGSYWQVDQHDKWKHLPDVEPNIEVRRIRESGNPVAVRRRDVRGKQLIVCGWSDPDTDFRDVYLIGEIPAKEGWDRGIPAEYDPQDTRLVAQGFLDTYGRRTSGKAKVPGVRRRAA